MSRRRYNTIERFALATWLFLAFFATVFIIAHT